MKKRGLVSRVVSGFLSCAMLSCMASIATREETSTSVTASASGSTYMMEDLDRGIIAIDTGEGMLVSWRFLATDSDSTTFKLYRDGTLIYTSGVDEATCYLDPDGSSSSTYRVDTINNGSVTDSETCTLTADDNYFQIDLDAPTSSSCTYSPNDCSVGDADGDGEYEIFLKWDPSNSKDNSQSGTTGNVYIDCIKLDGTRLWRIDLGCNIRAGAHYTQFYVADYDLDGYAEMCCKTADGTIDGLGNVIGDATADYRNSNGYIITGPEYYTLFDGYTGEALDTIEYPVPRGSSIKSVWGDSYGNRVDRFWGTVAYLDGVTPCVVTGRGYYTRLTAAAYTVVDKKLVQLWLYDSGTGSGATLKGYGNGNHQSMAADVDGDGKQEIVTGSTCIDDDGTLLWCNRLGHGDAMHLGDFLPDRDGLELWVCHEDSPYGCSLIDAATGETIFHYDGDSDTGRCCADNVWAGNDGAEFWAMSSVYDGDGNVLSMKRPSVNFLCYWDGDLEREILDGGTDSPATISKVTDSGSLSTLFSTDGYYTCNTTKATPCLSADILGDWREEVIVRAADGNSIRIYCTTYDTDYRVQTLMQDPQYRVQVASQNTAYNQPPHASFYLGSDEELPTYIDVDVVEATAKDNGNNMDTSVSYVFKNVGSGKYLSVEDSIAAAGTNVCQVSSYSIDASIWSLEYAGDGYYYIISHLGDGKTYYLDLDYGNTENGTNIGIYTDTQCDAQLFKFIPNSDGSYTIVTKSTADASALAVKGNSDEAGANILQWELTDTDYQHWWCVTTTVKVADTIDTNYTYMLKNSNSGLYMEIESATQADGTNVQQWGADGSSSHNTWYMKSAGSGYYYIVSTLGDGSTWYLNITDGSSKTGTNVEITSTVSSSAQLFKFVENDDGTYTIYTKASKDACAVEVADSSTKSGANVQQATDSGATNQHWILEVVSEISTSTTSILGDVNLDGSVTVLDVVLYTKYFLGMTSLTSEALAQGDMNQDGSNTIYDLTLLKQYLLAA